MKVATHHIGGFIKGLESINTKQGNISVLIYKNFVSDYEITLFLATMKFKSKGRFPAHYYVNEILIIH